MADSLLEIHGHDTVLEISTDSRDALLLWGQRVAGPATADRQVLARVAGTLQFTDIDLLVAGTYVDAGGDTMTGDLVMDGADVVPGADATGSLGRAGLRWAAVMAAAVVATTLTGTLATAAQPNVTSLGAYAAHLVPNVDNGLNLGAPGTRWANVYATSLSGTLATAAQPNVTSLGVLTGLTVGGTSILAAVAGSASYAITRGAVGNAGFNVLVSGDATPRWNVTAGGTLEWSGGSGTADTNLYRAAANTLATDDQFRAITTGLALRLGTEVGSSSYAAFDFRTFVGYDAATATATVQGTSGKGVRLTVNHNTFGSGTVALSADTAGVVTIPVALSVTGTSTLTGNVGVGGSSVGVAAMWVQSTPTGAATHYGVLSEPTAGANATGLQALRATPKTAASVYTVPYTAGLWVANASKGAGSTITTQYGLYVESLSSGTANYAIYTAGTTPSYFGGQVLLPTAGSAGGIVLAGDTNLYRSAGNTLATDDSFVAAGTITTTVGTVNLGADVTLSRGAANRLDMGSGDSLYVSGGGYVQTVDGYFFATHTTSTTGVFVARVAGDTANRFSVQASGTLVWSDGSLAVDVTLGRGAANELHLGTGDSLRVRDASLQAYNSIVDAYGQSAYTNIVFRTSVTGETQYRLQVRTDGLLSWSSGSALADVTLSRGAANRLDLGSGDSLRLDGGGNVLIYGGGGVTVNGWDNGAGAGAKVVVGHNSNAATPAAAFLQLYDKGASAYRIWPDDSGLLRIHTADPTNANDTAGTVVGDQTSDVTKKHVLGAWTDYAGAYRRVMDVPLWSFQFKENSAYRNRVVEGFVIHPDERGSWISRDDFREDSPAALNVAGILGTLTGAVKHIGSREERLEDALRTILILNDTLEGRDMALATLEA